MMNEKLHTGFAIAIAWPETYCKQPGSWYDPITLVLGINKNHYYKVGHAALVLINSIEKKCHYFDFGRYHSPFQHGRVRGANTDHDLIMNTIPVISKNKERIENFREILIELQNNKACHGEGEIHASYSSINFKKALHKVIQMQNAKSIAYGPFRIKGSNCSRFVNTAIIAGKPQLKHRFKLKYFNPLSPTPKSNVKALHNYLIIEKKLSNKPFQPLKPLPKNLLKVTLNPPKRNNSIPANAQWLSGEGAGSWYSFEHINTSLYVNRYSPEGETECLGLFKAKENYKLTKLDNLQITYPSNCAEVSLKENDRVYKFVRQ